MQTSAQISATPPPRRGLQLPLLQTGASRAVAPLLRPARLRTALVSMPFVSALRPSIQLGLLKAIGERHGHRVDTFHLNLSFGQQVGLAAYEALCAHRGVMFGEWFFSLDAFGSQAPDREGRLAGEFEQEFAELVKLSGLSSRELLKLRSEGVPAYLDRVCEKIRWQQFDVVGFTSTFQQTVASGALAQRIRAIHPSVKIIFGGANLDGDMGKEVVRTFPVIDYGVSGEADTTFPALLGCLERGEDPGSLPGVITRRDDAIVGVPPRAPISEMDELPAPNYDEYFQTREQLGLLPPGESRNISLPFETSRGCWWGQKSHCTFCGLNGATMKYRSKSAERVLSDLAELSRRYQTFRFDAVDNILDHRHFKDLLPRLAEEDTSYDLFYEVKSNLGRAQVKKLHEAGVRRIQPGIESLSSAILRLMRKGVKAVQNVNLMRWARYYGIEVGWNLIYGFPGETVEDHARQTALLPLLVHLQPPTSSARVWMERFSPLFRERDEFPARRLAPEKSYQYVFPSSTNLNELAYFFDYELEDCLRDEQVASLREAANDWHRTWRGEKKPRLSFVKSGSFLQVDDERQPGPVQTHTFEGALARIYHALSDRPETATSLLQKLELGVSEDALTEALGEFCRRGLMMEDEGFYLSLALPAGVVR